MLVGTIWMGKLRMLVVMIFWDDVSGDDLWMN